MKIGIFSESYEPIVNGVSVSVAVLRDGLVSRGHDVFVFAPAYPGHKDDYDKVVRVPSNSLFVKGYPLPYPRIPDFRHLGLDIVHTQIPFTLGTLAQNVCLKEGIPVVSTNHTLYADYAHYCKFLPQGLTVPLLIKWMRRYYNRCRRVCVPSGPIGELLRSYGVTVPLDVIKTGIKGVPDYTEADKAEARAKLGVPEDKTMLLYVGRVAEEKNLGLLMKSLAALKRSDVVTYMVGGGPALHEIENEARALGVGEIVFTGMLDHAEIIPYLMAADVFAFPSVTDTQGIAVAEAMSAALPCVSMNAGGIPENMTDGVDGFLCENRVESYSAALKKLFDDPDLRRKMGENAKKDSARFSVGGMIDKFEEFYSKALYEA